jgi:eukaryotic-like serine/threonine-protein kinase
VAIRADSFPPRYQDVEHIARGGMGDIYRATDAILGRTVVIKVLAERFSGDDDVKRRFKNEGLAAARLSAAPSTVTIFDVGESDEQPFIVMEFLEGGSLEQRLRTGPQQTSDVLRWLEQAASALDAGHAAGVVHRDVKPGNLLLDGRGDLHVADFGVASAAGLDSMTMTGMVLGTVGYLSPEQAQGERATPASDRYALAVVAWELLTGSRPFESQSPTAEAAAHVNAPIPSLSSDLDPVFRRALAKEPGARYPTAGAFVTELRRALEDQPTTAPAPLPPTRSRSLLLPMLVAAGVILLAAGLGLAVIFGGGGQPKTQTVVSTKRSTQTVTTAPEPPPPPTPAKSGVALTDEATNLLGQGRWREAEPIARQAVSSLKGSGQLYEAYAEYDLGRALAEQGKCGEALQHLGRSEQLQGARHEITDAKKKCQ